MSTVALKVLLLIHHFKKHVISLPEIATVLTHFPMPLVHRAVSEFQMQNMKTF